MARIKEYTRKSGKKSYQVEVRVTGQKPISKTFSTKTAAKEWAKHTEVKLREAPHLVTNDRHTISEAIERYKKTVLPEKAASTQWDQTHQLEWWDEHYGHMRLANFTPAVLSEARDVLLSSPLYRNKKNTGRTLSAATVTRYMASMSHLLRIANSEWRWIPTNPAISVRKPKTDNARTRFLSDDELKRLTIAIDQTESSHLKPAFWLALTTGARANEVMSLRWDQIDLSGGRVTLSGEKTKTPRTLALSPDVAEILKAIPRRIDTPLLFPNKKDPTRPATIKKAWETALKRAQIDDFRWHDLRHTAASYLAMEGASLAELAGVLGHKTLAMVQRYSHLSREHVATVSTRIADRVKARL